MNHEPASKDLTDEFLKVFKETAPPFYKEVAKTADRHPQLFVEVAEPILRSISKYLGEGWGKKLVDGYVRFVIDVNRSQKLYESVGKYPEKSFSHAFEEVYNSPEYMEGYHWGVLVTTFAWEHHLLIYQFFRDYFLSLDFQKKGRIIDLGAGSGIWHMMALRRLRGWTVTAIDISKHTASLARAVARENNLESRINFVLGDALEIKFDEPFDAGISCFLLEHLERPENLLVNLCKNLAPHGYAFITAALTAAEIDHIREFRRESEIVSMAESAGFRVIATFSSAPVKYNTRTRFLPRSMALVLQKRASDIW